MPPLSALYRWTEGHLERSSRRDANRRRPGGLSNRTKRRGPARAEDQVNDTDARLWHPWLRINRVLRVMLRTRWSAEAWSIVRVEFRRALALRSEIRRVSWFI